MAAAFMFLRMADPRDEQRAWLRGVLAQTGLAPTALAQKAKVAQPTITTFLNKPDVSHALSARTISKIEAATGLRYGPDPRPAGFRESEATPFERGIIYFSPLTIAGESDTLFPSTREIRK